jgi:undecaprenyl diphosphate synthase
MHGNSELINQIDKSKLPQHIAIIMDGNGRWAKKQGLSRIFGHNKGADAVRNVTEATAELGFHFLHYMLFQPKIGTDLKTKSML